MGILVLGRVNHQEEHHEMVFLICDMPTMYGSVLCVLYSGGGPPPVVGCYSNAYLVMGNVL